MTQSDIINAKVMLLLCGGCIWQGLFNLFRSNYGAIIFLVAAIFLAYRAWRKIPAGNAENDTMETRA